MAIAHHSDMAMDLTIEAVTGTIYDLCVSPFETILGIKTKIQRLEGNQWRERAPSSNNQYWSLYKDVHNSQ
jgi:hypothetical protein